MTPLKRLALQVEKIKEYGELSDVGDIARRYFVMNAFDGALTIIGVLVGSYAADISQPNAVVITGMSTALAMGISGLWGATLTETAERKRSLNELEEATLSNLEDTKIGKASRMAVVVVAMADALAPVGASVFVLLPFFLASLLQDITLCYYSSLALGLGTLFALGVFLGHVSRENLVVSGLKTASAGLMGILVGILLKVSSV